MRVTDENPHHHGYADDIDACVVSSTGDAHPDDTYADDAHQLWPDGAQEGAHRTRTGGHQLLVEVHPDDAHPYGAHRVAHDTANPESPARYRESNNDAGGRPNAPRCEPSSTDGGNGRTRRRHRR